MKKIAMIVAVAGLAGAAQAQSVDLELSLLLDVSGSVDGTEFALQRDGYVSAFNDPTLFTAISQGAIGSIAVNLVYWSGAGEVSQSVGWTIIDSVAASQAFAAAVAAAPRPFSGLTAPGTALNFATPLIFNNNITSTRQVIDVSGDGEQNDGANTAAARDAALAAGVDAINGLAIGGAGLAAWYAANIQGGQGSFVEIANDFNDFGSAIRRKLVREITNVVPSPVAGGMGLAGLMVVGARRRRA